MKRAISLPEAVLAGLVVALVVTALAQLYPLTVVTLARSERRLKADQLAESVLDATQAEPFAALPVGQERRLGPVVQGEAACSVTVRAFQPPGTNSGNLKALQVEVRWAEKGWTRRVTHERWIVDLPR